MLHIILTVTGVLDCFKIKILNGMFIKIFHISQDPQAALLVQSNKMFDGNMNVISKIRLLTKLDRHYLEREDNETILTANIHKVNVFFKNTIKCLDFLTANLYWVCFLKIWMR